VIDTIDDDGKLNDAVRLQPIVGLDRFEARKRIKPALEASGHLIKTGRLHHQNRPLRTHQFRGGAKTVAAVVCQHERAWASRRYKQ
jgi:isoleucyl-tRNA synthetase